jgi:CheY-like chemotaxis protein
MVEAMKKIQNVLIADDDVASSFLITMTLEEMGIAERIVSVYNGQQALDFLEASCISSIDNFCPAFILLDLNMPVMDGFEFLDEFARRYPDLKGKISICILTSSAAARDLLKAQQYHVAGFITKPLTPINLMAILEHF